MSDRTPQDQDKYVLRFPDGMRDRLKDVAAKNNRSMNAEIVARLEQSFDPLVSTVRNGGDMMDEVAKIAERVVRKIREEERKEGLAPLPYDPKD